MVLDYSLQILASLLRLKIGLLNIVEASQGCGLWSKDSKGSVLREDGVEARKDKEIREGMERLDRGGGFD